jgi:hypothetical protein
LMLRTRPASCRRAEPGIMEGCKGPSEHHLMI